jgi:cephalosporin hydroxylase
VWVLDTDHGVGLVERMPASEPLVVLDDAQIDALDYATLSARRTTLLGLAPPAAFDALLASAPAAGEDDAYASALPPQLLDDLQRGVMATCYKGLRLLKSPFDLALYLQLLDQLRPGSVIEIGSFEGGSSVWFADQMAALGLAPRVLAIDRDREPLHHDPRVRFLKGDAEALGKVLDQRLLAEWPRPWLVVEDSAHTRAASLAVLEFFDAHLRPGDYIVVEDGVVRHLPGEVYRRYEDGPCRALTAFLKDRKGRYEVDRTLCDFYGRNVTYNPGGWLRRTG